MSASVLVFVGSTFTDLQPYRAAAREALHGLEAVVRGMEYFGSLPETPKEECLRIVRGCRIYVGLFAMRYGSLDPATGKSLTQLEYEEAQRIGLPSLIYLIDEERQPILPKFVDTGDGAAKLIALKDVLRSSHVVSFFTSPEDLAAKITRDIPRVASRAVLRCKQVSSRGSSPPYRASTGYPDDRFAFLKRELGCTVEPIQSDAVLREALEFILAGDNLAASFLIARTTRLDLRESTDLLMSIEEVLKAIIARGVETAGAKRADPGD